MGRPVAPDTGWRAAQLGGDGSANTFAVDNSISTAKYTAASWLPRSLMEQFRRIANVYFLGISVLMMVGSYAPHVFQSPLSPFSTFGTLVLVLFVTSVKEGLEDYKRHQSDLETNHREAQVWVDGALRPVLWKNLRVGQVVRVGDKDKLPADLVLLMSNQEDGSCYVETSNIDGETNLKIRGAPAGSVAHFAGRADPGADVGGSVEFEAPNKYIHTFEGTLKLPGCDPVALDAHNVLLRGSTLRNTRFAFGVVVYTGSESKIMKNAHGTPSKLSNVEKTVNQSIKLVFFSQFVLVTVSTVFSLTFDEAKMDYYLHFDDSESLLPDWLAQWFTFLILFNNFIPISLYVTIEIINFVQALFINYDRSMLCRESQTYALARTSNLCQELGQIQYIFSDKTGTLTRNVMAFKRCSVGGVAYGGSDAAVAAAAAAAASAAAAAAAAAKSKAEGSPAAQPTATATPAGASSAASRPQKNDEEDEAFADADLRAALADAGSERAAWVREFFTVLAVCHTVVPEHEADGSVTYQAESPDEGALVKAARRMGFAFVDRTPGSVVLDTPTGREVYDVLAVNAFNSTRKRMSVVVRRPDGRVTLMCKGADNIMFERADREQSRKQLTQHLSDFASDGLRTLVVAERDLSAEEYRAWDDEYQAALVAQDDRAARVAAAAEAVERGMKVVGATAIEDRLQDGVPGTIADLARGGIKLWVLTGDKMETAINIGYSARLLVPDMKLIKIVARDDVPPERAVEALRQQLTDLVSVFEGLTGGGASTRVGQLLQRFGAAVLPRASQPASALAAAAAEATADSWHGSAHESQARSSRHGASWHGSSHDVEAPPPAAAAAAPAAPVVPPPPARSSAGRSSAGNSPKLSSRARLSPKPSAGAEEPQLTLEDFESDHLALVMDGPSLVFILGDPDMSRMLLQLARLCKAVIACRVSPAQKANIVALVKDGVRPMPMTLAIGDGANDVGMIQEAHLGVGVSGKEGMQAVNSSDFAIAQFRFLKRLLVVHGRWNYRRIAKVILYSFYKNIVLTITLFLYSFFTAFSGTSLYESLIYSGFNFFTGLGPLAVGILDQDLSAATMLRHPEIYVDGRLNVYLNVRKMARWIGTAVVHALVIFGVPFLAAEPSDGLFLLGTFVYTCLVFSMLAKLALIVTTWTSMTCMALAVSFVMYTCFAGVYSQLVSVTPEYFGVFNEAFSLPRFWVLVLTVPLVLVMIDLALEHVRLQFFPSPTDIMMEADRGYGGRDATSTHTTISQLRSGASRKTVLPLQALEGLVGSVSESGMSDLGIQDMSSPVVSGSSRGFAFSHVSREFGSQYD